MRKLFSTTVVSLAAAIFGLQLLSSGAAIYLLRTEMQQVVHADRARQLFDVRDDLLATYYEAGAAALRSRISERRGSTANPLIFVALVGREPSLLSNLAAVPQGISTVRPTRTRIVHAPGLPASEGIAVATVLPDRSTLIVGASTVAERGFDLAFAEAIGLTLALTVGLALLSATLLGMLVSRRTHSIAMTAEALAAGNFAARVSGGSSGDGFDHLRRQMNLMAERIDELVRQLQSVAGALAHDLRSPVARLKASIDTALAAEPGPRAEEALQLARTDAEALQQMLSAALELSRIESGVIADRREMLDLSEVVADLVELYEPLAELSGVDLVCTVAPIKLPVDRELMARALANLIDNALKYGGNRIEVGCRLDSGHAVVSVADNGPGIAAADRARAVGRFTRLDNARTRPGAGLGLAMAAAVAHLHNGKLELSGGSPLGDDGLVATIRLPIP